MQAMKELHEESLQKITTDAKEKIALCQTQVSRQVSLLEQVGELEGALEQERKERCRLEGELVRHRAAGSSVSHQLLALYGQARDAGLALRRKLDQFERFQLQIALALEDGASSCGLPVASLTPDESRALIESGGEWNGRLDAPVDGDDDCFLRKNDFLREQCDHSRLVPQAGGRERTHTQLLRGKGCRAEELLRGLAEQAAKQPEAGAGERLFRRLLRQERRVGQKLR